MIICAILSAYFLSLQMVFAIHFENPILTILCGILYIVTLSIALDRESKLKSRINKLEQKLKKYESEDNDV